MVAREPVLRIFIMLTWIRKKKEKKNIQFIAEKL